MDKRTRQKYLSAQAKSGIRKGSMVKVLHKAYDEENGWGNSWVGDMDDMIGHIYLVEKVTNDGIQLRVPNKEYTLGFPYFVLEKITKATK